MFKKRTRPASVRKALDGEEDETPLTSEAESGTATPTAEGYVSPQPRFSASTLLHILHIAHDADTSQSVEDMILLRKLRRAEKQQGIDLERLNRGEERKKAKEPEIEYDKFGLHPSTSTPTPAEADEDVAQRMARKVMSNNFTQQTNALDTDKHM